MRRLEGMGTEADGATYLDILRRAGGADQGPRPPAAEGVSSRGAIIHRPARSSKQDIVGQLAPTGGWGARRDE